MRTTVDLPDDLLERTRIAAVKRRTSVKSLIVAGLQRILDEEASPVPESGALASLEAGYHLGGQALRRDDTHDR